MTPEIGFSLERHLYEAQKLTPPQNFVESLQVFLFTQMGEKNELWFDHLARAAQEVVPSPEIKMQFMIALKAVQKQEKKLTNWNFWRLLWRRPFFWALISTTILGGFALWFLNGFIFGRPVDAPAISEVLSSSGAVTITEHAGITPSARLSTGEVLTTANGTLEVCFFDGSFLVLDQNTTVRIEKQIPDPSFPDIGKLELVLEKGHVWLRTFTDPAEDSSVTLRSGDIVITPFSAALDMSQTGNRVVLRIWQRSAQVADLASAQSHILIAGSKAILTSGKEQKVETLAPREQANTWVQEMLQRDSSYRQQELDKALKRFRDGVGVLPDSKWYRFKLWREGNPEALKGKPQEYSAQLFRRFEETILLAETGDQIRAQETLARGVAELKAALAISPELEPFIAHLFLQLRKYLLVLPADSVLREVRTAILAAEAEIFADSPVFLARHILEYLWEIQSILLGGNNLLPREALEQYTALKELLPNAFSKDPAEKRQLLRVKIQEIALLDYLFTKVFAEESIRENEDKVIAEALAIIEERAEVTDLTWSDARFAPEENPITVFQNELARLTIPAERRAKAASMIAQIPLSPANLSWLNELRHRSNLEVRELATQKIISILESEERKTIISFP